MRHTIYILIALLSISCYRSGNIKNINLNLKSDSIKVDDIKPLSINETITLNPLFIKERYQEYSTSTILNKSEIKGIYSFDTTGFFGSYILIDSASLEKHGSLIVFNNGVPQNWRYDNPDDFFIKLDYHKGDLGFFNDIRIGMDRKELEEKISGKIKNNQDSLIQAYIGNYSVDLYMINNKVSRILITLNDNK